MGAAASVGLGAGLQQATLEELNVALSALPSHDVQKLHIALSQASESAAANASIAAAQTDTSTVRRSSKRWTTRRSLTDADVSMCDGANRAAADVPSPEYFLQQFDTVDFAAQPYAETMFKSGREPKSDAEKVWRSRYTANLLNDAVLAVEATLGADAAVVEAYRAMLPLTETIVYEVVRWNAEAVPMYQACISALDGVPPGPEVEQLLGMLFKIKDMFYWEMQNPKQDFYMCLLDEMHVENSRGELHAASVSQESLRMMHAIDMDMHIKRSDQRRDIIAAFYARLYVEGLAGCKEWDLQTLLAEYGNKDEMKALSSETPLLSFELDESEPMFPGYVLMEGSGRLAALNAALDVVREKHPHFVAPLISISVVPFYGSPMARRNLCFFLSLTWRCTFPALDVPGFFCQVCDSVRQVSAELAKKVLISPRYFGFHPIVPPGQFPPTIVGGG